MSTKPLISILVTTYNRFDLLQRALATVHAQTMNDWECVIVDDGSTDETLAFLKVVAADDSRFRIMTQDHAGQRAALNRAKGAAQGGIICFLDSDDQYMPEHLAMQRDALANADFVYGQPLVTGSPLIPDALHHKKLISVDSCYVLGTFACRKEVLPASFEDFPAYGLDYFWYKHIRNSGWRIKKAQHRTYLYDRSAPDELTKQ